MPELLARNDSQQQIQSFYFIEVMNDYLQDVESGQAFLLNEIRKNTGNIRLRADNVTMNTQQIELLLGGLYSHENYNELQAHLYTPAGVEGSDVTPTSSYLIQELDINDNPTGNVILTQNPSDLESTEYGLILQDVLWEEIAGTNGGAPTYKEVSSFRYARDQIQAISESEVAITAGLTAQTTALETAITPIHTTTFENSSATRNLVDVHTALINVYNAVSGQDTTNVNSLAGVSEAISSSMDSTTEALVGTTVEWGVWDEHTDLEKQETTVAWQEWNLSGQGSEPEKFVYPEPDKYPAYNLYDIINTEINEVTTTLTGTVDLTLQSIDKALRSEGYLKTIDLLLTDKIDIKVSNLETLLLNTLNIPGATLNPATGVYEDDNNIAVDYTNLNSISSSIDKLFLEGEDSDNRTLYDLYENITKIHSTTVTTEYASLWDVKGSIDGLFVTAGLDGKSIFDLDSTITTEFSNLRDGKTLTTLDDSIGGVEAAIQTLQGTDTFTVQSLEGKVVDLFEVTDDVAKTSIFDLNFNLVDDTNGQFRLLKDDLTKAYVNGEDRLNIPGLGDKINRALLGTVDNGTSGVDGTSVTSVIGKEISALENMLIGSTALVGDTSNLYEIEKDIERIRGLVGDDVEDITKKNLKDLHTSLESIKGGDYKKDLNDIYDRLGNLSLEVNNVAVNTDQLEQLIGWDFTRDLYTDDYTDYVNAIYEEINTTLYADTILASGIEVEDYVKNPFLAYSSSFWQDKYEALDANNEIFIYGGDSGRAVSDESGEGHPLTEVDGFSSVFDRMSESQTTIENIESTLGLLNEATRENSYFTSGSNQDELNAGNKTIQKYLHDLDSNINAGLINGVSNSTSRIFLLNDDLNEGLFTHRDEQSGEEPKLDRITNELLRLQGDYPSDWVSTTGSPHDGFTNNQFSNLYKIEKDIELIRGDTPGNSSDLNIIELRLLDIQGYSDKNESLLGITSPSVDTAISVLRNFRGGALDTVLQDKLDDGTVQSYDSEDLAHNPETTLYPTLKDLRDVLNGLRLAIDQMGGVVSTNPGKIEDLSSNFFELGNQVNSLRGDVPPLNPEFFGYNYEEVRNFHKFSEQYDPTLVARDEEHPNDEEGNPYVVPSENPYDFNTSNLYNIDQRLQTLNQSLMGVDVVIPPAADGDLLSNIKVITSGTTSIGHTNLYDVEYAIDALMGDSEKTFTDVEAAIIDLQGKITISDTPETDDATIARLAEVLISYPDFTQYIPNQAYEYYLSIVENNPTYTTEYILGLMGWEEIPPETILSEAAFESRNLVDLYYKIEELSGNVLQADPLEALSNLELSVSVKAVDTIRSLVGWDYAPDGDLFDEAAWAVENRNIFDEIQGLSNALTATGISSLNTVENKVGQVAGAITGVGSTLLTVENKVGTVAGAITGDGSTLATVEAALTGASSVKTAVNTVETTVGSLSLGDKYTYIDVNGDPTRVIDNPPLGEVEYTAFADIYNAIIDQTEEVKKVKLEVGDVTVNTNQLERLLGWDFDTNVEFDAEDGDDLYQNTLFQRLEIQKKDIIDAIQEVTVNIGDVAVNTDQLESIIGWNFKAKIPTAAYDAFLDGSDDTPVTRQEYLDTNPALQWDDLYESDEGEESIVGGIYDTSGAEPVLTDNNTILYRLSDAVTYLSNIDADTGFLHEAFTTGVAHQDLTNLTASINNIEADANSLSTSIDNLVKAIDDPDVEGDQALNHYLNTVKETIAGLDTSITGTLNVSITGLDTSVGQLKGEVATGSALNQNLSNLKDSLASSGDLVTKLSTLDTSLGDLETDVTSLVGVVDENSTLNSNLSSVTTKVEDLTNAIVNADVNTPDLTDALGTLEAVFAINGTLLNNLSTVGANLGTLETDVTSLIGVVDGNSALTTAMDGIKTSLTTSIDSSLETIDNSLEALIADDFSTNFINSIKGYVAATESDPEIPGSTLDDIKSALVGGELGTSIATALGSISFDTTALTGTTPGRTLEELWLRFDDLTVPGEYLDLIDVSQDETPNNIVPKTLADVATSVETLEDDIAKVKEGLINETNMGIYNSYWLTGIAYPEGAVSEDIIIPVLDPVELENRVKTTDAFTEATGLFVYKLDEVAQAVTALKEFQKPTEVFENGSKINIPVEGENPAIKITEEVFTCSRGVTVTAHTENSGILFIGNSELITAGTNPVEDGIPLTAGDALFLPVLDPAKIFVIADSEASGSPNALYWLAV